MSAVSNSKIECIPNGLDGIARVFVGTKENSPEKEIANSLVLLLEGCGKKHSDFKTFNQAVLGEALEELNLDKKAINLAIKQAGGYKPKEFAAFLSQILTKGKHSKTRYKAILKLFVCLDLQRMINSLVLVANYVYDNFDLPVTAELIIDGAILVYNGEDVVQVACKIGKANYFKQESLSNVNITLSKGQTYEEYLSLGLAKTFYSNKIKSVFMCIAAYVSGFTLLVALF